MAVLQVESNDKTFMGMISFFYNHIFIYYIFIVIEINVILYSR